MPMTKGRTGHSPNPHFMPMTKGRTSHSPYSHFMPMTKGRTGHSPIPCYLWQKVVCASNFICLLHAYGKRSYSKPIPAMQISAPLTKVTGFCFALHCILPCRMRYTAHFDKRSCVPALLSALTPNLMRIIDTWGKRPRVRALLPSSPIFFLVRQPKGALVFDSQGELSLSLSYHSLPLGFRRWKGITIFAFHIHWACCSAGRRPWDIA